ncbi:hypothetical protein F4821DRAFT_257562 [Hypoxylon rubiginosum]|uniref:Uncharacterized protein n=1 Tax=Hypoxylon rubiginosum TaxID=110542 RepID=A0ACC0D7I7_9PEZI|nr:hypothetical protein F4821DRAFT_257562 [Hypoxylon rubiginosum]
MKTFGIFSFLSWMAATATAGYSGIPDGYSLGNVTWVGNITAGGPEVTFTGASFPEIEAQIRQANPNFAWPEHDVSSADKAMLVDHLSCDLPQFYYAVRDKVIDGIDYLRGKTGQCHMDAGPYVCSRISCSYDSAIFWCNDNDTPLTIDCGLWSEYAQNILDECQTDDASEHIKGQQFNVDNWNIIVGYSKC